MRFADKRIRIALVFLFLLVLFAGHRIVRYYRGRAHSHAAESALQRRDFRLALVYLKKYLEVWPNDLSVRLLAAQTARRQTAFDDAIEHLRIYEQNNGSVDTLKFEYQLIRMQSGNIDEGILLSAWLERPDAPQTPLVLEAIIEGSLAVLEPATARGATFGFDSDKVTPYLTMVRKAADLWLRLRPGPADQVQGLVWRGRLHEVAGDHPKALADLRKALELDPDHFGARLHLALSVVQESSQETVRHLELLRRREPGHKRVRFVLANAHRLLGQPEEARQFYDELLADYPNEVSILVQRGLVELDVQRARDAEGWLRRALALAPNDPEANLALSRCLRGLARVEEAALFQERFQQIQAARRQK